MPIPLSRYKKSLIPNNFNIRNRTIFTKKEYPFIFQVNNTQLISGQFSTIIGKSISVDWGDGGARSTYSGTDQAWSKDYDSAGDRTVRIFGSVVLTKFQMTAAGADISFDIKNLPTGVTNLGVSGNNSLFGDIANLPAGLLQIQVWGKNTITGNIGNSPSGLIWFNIFGFCTVFGNIGKISNNITEMQIYGLNTISNYTNKTWTTKPTKFIIVPVGAGGLSEAEIDQLFIDFDDDLVWTADNVITLTGTNAAPSVASAAARTNIANEGCTITTN